MKNFFLLFILILFTAFVTKNYFHDGFPYTHDGENHLVRFANYKIAIKEKQFPPRFAPNLYNHYGYPVLNYNYPLANIISLPFSFLKINYEFTFKIIVFSSVFLGALGVFKYLTELKFSRRAAIFTSFFWMASPYLLSLLNFRGSIGEILAFALLPWVFWCIETAQSSKFFSSYQFFFTIAILTTFLLSHNITAVFSLPPITLVLLIRYQKNKTWYLHFLVAFAVSICVSLWFWLPALAEMNQIVVGESSSNQEFFTHFPILHQLLFSPIQFGFSKAGTIDSLSFQIGIFVIIGMLYWLILFLKSLIKKEKVVLPSTANVSFISIVFLIFLQLSVSQGLWSIFPQLKFIQFPWRLTIFITVFSLPLIATVVDRFLLKHKKSMALILILQVLFLLSLKPVDYFHKTNVDYDAFAGTTSTQNENRPKTFNFSEVGEWKPGPQIASESGTISSITTWTGSQHEYAVEINAATEIVEPTAYFLGWETEFKTNGEDWKQLSYTTETTKHGLITYPMEEGVYQVRTRFTQNTPARLWGNSLSLLIAAFLVGYGMYLKNKQLL